MDFPSVAEFYDGKTILLTGATGFLGVVLLEELLRICPGINRIYLVIRTKKGVEPKIRLEKLFERKIFSALKREHADRLEKVHLITGDLEKNNIGISEEAMQTIIDEVSIVFHVAASISFAKPLKAMLEQNFLSTHILAELSRKLRKCDAFVYTSSSYGNCNRFNIETEEEIYRLPFQAEKFLDILLNNGTDEELENLRSQCYPPWPNAYSFSKNLTENYLVENASDLPVAIIRPSVISVTYEKPFPGYVEDTSGTCALCIGIGRGVIRVAYADPDIPLDTVPADFTAHAHVIAAARIPSGRWNLPMIVNSSSVHRLPFKDHAVICKKMVDDCPAPLVFREATNIKIIRNHFVFELLSFYEHFVPAYGMDLLLRLSGKKPKLVPLYKFIKKVMDSTRYFSTRKFMFKTENFHKLLRDLNEEDKKLFVNPDAGEYTLKGCEKLASFYDWSKDKKTPAERRRAAKRNDFMANVFKIIFLLMVAGIIYLLVWLLKTIV